MKHRNYGTFQSGLDVGAGGGGGRGPENWGGYGMVNIYTDENALVPPPNQVVVNMSRLLACLAFSIDSQCCKGVPPSCPP